MREILNYPQIDRQKLDIVKDTINSIAENPNRDCSHELSKLNHIAGKIYTTIHFMEYWGWTDLDTLAESVLTTEPPCIHDLRKYEIKEIVSIVKTCFILGEDNKAEYYIELLHKSLSLPNIIDYIMSEEEEDTIANNLIIASSCSVIAL